MLDSYGVVEGRDQFECLYRAHAGAVRSFVHRRSNRADADDLVAEVFLAAWRRRDEVPADPFPWLLGIARGLLANSRRREVRSTALVARIASEQVAAAGGIAPDLDTATSEALGSLSEGDQELLLLVAWEGLSREQVAGVLGVRPGTVAVRLHRARGRLRRALEDQRRHASADRGRSPGMEVL